MATLGIRLIPLQAMTANRRAVFERLCERIGITHAAAPRYLDGQARVWLIYDDPRFTLLDAAIIGCVTANIGLVPDNATLTRAQVVAFVQSNIVLPADVVIAEGEDPYQKVMAANGAPVSAIQMRAGIPPGLTPEVVA